MPSPVISHGGPLNESARSVFELLLVFGPLSRAELARRLALSGGALTRITRPMIDAGIVHEQAAEQSSTSGRPSQPLDIDVDFAHFLGLKLTGDALFAVRTDARGDIQEQWTATLVDHAVESAVDLVAAAVDALGGTRPIAGLGVSLSGNATREEPSVRMSPFLNWYGVPLATIVEERTGIPTVLENDVRALTAAEQWFGETSHLQSFAVLTFGAGIGCGMVTNGQQIEGNHGASGLIGHLPVDDRGPFCYAGHRGCAHAFATIGAVTKAVGAALGVTHLTFAECVELARQGDAVARAVFDEAGRAIGTLLGLITNLLGPEKIVVAGDGVEMFLLGERAARERMTELLHWTATEVEIVVQPFSFFEWARGAAVVAVQQYVRQLDAIPVV